MRRWRWLSLGVVLLLIVAALVAFWPRVEVTTDRGIVSISLARAGTVTNGYGEPVIGRQAEAIVGRGGPPIVSVNYNFEASDTGSCITIERSDGLSTIYLPKNYMRFLGGEKNLPEIEARVNAAAQKYFEVWLDLSQNPEMYECFITQRSPLLDCERLVKQQGRDYLVTTTAYFAVHIYSLEPLRFITRINGLDAGPITGEWWN